MITHLLPCESQLNSAEGKQGFLSTPIFNPIMGGFGARAFNGSLTCGFSPSATTTTLNGVVSVVQGTTAPMSRIYFDNPAWQQLQAITPANFGRKPAGSGNPDRELSTFNKLYKGRVNSHSVGLYSSKAPPKQKRKAECQGGTTPTS